MDPMAMSGIKTILFYAGMMLLVLSAIEVASFLFFGYGGLEVTFFDRTAYTLEGVQIAKLRPAYDPQLGWVEHYKTPFGERPRETDYPRSLMATFGDSYTRCDQVHDNQTWQTYMARELKQDIFNFGSSGYGTDQAYLRFRRDYPKVRTPLVCLGIISESINRLVNVYRKFYYIKTGIPMTKPRFLLSNHGLEQLENPIRSQADLVRLGNPEFIRRLGRNDLWYNPASLPERGFPYIYAWFHASVWREIIHGRLGNQISDLEPRPWINLWAQPQARSLMFAIIDRFVLDARRHGATPIIVLLAKRREVRGIVATGRHPSPLQILKTYLRQRHYLCFDAAAALATAARSREEVSSFYSGHLSDQGNRVVAKDFVAFLRTHKLDSPSKHPAVGP